MEGPTSGDDQDIADKPPRKKRYHRHTPQQIQELEAPKVRRTASLLSWGALTIKEEKSGKKLRLPVCSSGSFASHSPR
ncbi:hypothetical protein K1719_010795 [Acacia pycnantha]|nr:hypothetical protein K1719_010795 [Acacia pycnantha]